MKALLNTISAVFLLALGATQLHAQELTFPNERFSITEQPKGGEPDTWRTVGDVQIYRQGEHYIEGLLREPHDTIGVTGMRLGPVLQLARGSSEACGVVVYSTVEGRRDALKGIFTFIGWDGALGNETIIEKYATNRVQGDDTTIYEVRGKNPQATGEYTGTLTLIYRGAAIRAEWNLSTDEHFIGVGVKDRERNTLTIAYGVERDRIELGSYELRDGTWAGSRVQIDSRDRTPERLVIPAEPHH